GHVYLAEPRVVAAHGLDGDLGRGVHVDLDVADMALRHGLAVVQALQARERGEAPLLLAPGGNLEVGQVVGRLLVQGRQGLLVQAHQPTAPSICSSISRFSSSAYSMGSSRAIGSTKPRTVMAIVSASPSPRLMR